MKLLILLMSCNNPLYEKEEQACRETFIKDAEGAGVSYWFYRGLDESHPTQFFDNEEHILYLNARDTLSGTGRKTTEALKATLNMDYDYVLKTNVSTYLNIRNILSLLNGESGRDDRNIYGGRFIINEFSKDIPFPRGYFTILSKSTVEGMLPYMEALSQSTGTPRTDDTVMCLSLLYYYEKVAGERYIDHLREIPAHNAWGEPSFIPLENALAVRCKDETDKEKTPDHIKETHRRLRTGRGNETPKTIKPAYYETGFGMMTHGNYIKVKKVLELFMKKEKSVGGENQTPTDERQN